MKYIMNTNGKIALMSVSKNVSSASTVKRNCNNPSCGKEYFADKRNLSRGWGLCCSKSCAASLREKSKEGYDEKRVVINNFRRENWNNKSTTLDGKVSGYTSEGYRIIDGVAYDEFDDEVYVVDENDDDGFFSNEDYFANKD